MNEFSDTIGSEILKRYFPEAEPSKIDWHADWLSLPMVLHVSPYDFLKEGNELENRLQDFRRAMLAA